MKRLLLCMTVLCMAAAGVVLLGGLVQAQENVPRMTKEDLKPQLGNPDLILIDVRSMGDWQKDTLMIKGAVREDPVDVTSWMNQYPKEKTFVFYCSGMNEATSASVASKFQQKGYTKVYALKGGWIEWLGAKYPTEPKK